MYILIVQVGATSNNSVTFKKVELDLKVTLAAL